MSGSKHGNEQSLYCSVHDDFGVVGKPSILDAKIIMNGAMWRRFTVMFSSGRHSPGPLFTGAIEWLKIEEFTLHKIGRLANLC